MGRRSWGPSNDGGLRVLNWESHIQNPPPESKRRTHLIASYLFVLHSVTCLKTCHFTACLTSLWTSISVFYVNTACDVVTVLPILLNIYHFTYTITKSYTEAHTLKHTCTISTQEEWRQPDTIAWLRGAEERLLSGTKRSHTKNNKNTVKPPRFSWI